MPRWRAIVFDLDDTLYPEGEFVLSGFRAVSRWAADNLDISYEVAYAQLKSLFHQGVRGNTFNQWLAAVDKPPSLVSALVDVYRQHEPDIRPFPGVAPLLSSLRRRYSLGLVTDGYLDVQRRKLVALELSSYFDAVVFSDEWGKQAWKPDARPFNAIVDRLGIPAKDSVYIADNPLKDFLGARRGGFGTIWLRHARGDYCSLLPPSPDHAPDSIVESLVSLKELLQGADL